MLIITLISVSFSVTIYRVLTQELDRVERIERLRIERGFPQRRLTMPPTEMGDELPRAYFLDPKLITETKNRLILMLGVINAVILAASSLAGYFLAGRTLKPIKEMVEEQNRFITDASHELRTPLTSLKSEIEVNLRNKNLTLNEAHKLLASNLEEVNNLQVLSDNLIKLTQYQKGGNDFTATKLSLTSVVGEAVKKVTNLAKNNKILIVNKVHDYLIEGEKPALAELFVIFLDNAIKYSPEKSKVYLTSEKNGSYVVIRIKDEGIGINEKDINKLFDRFYRGDKSRTKLEVPGYGLGLSIAKQIVTRHRGSIYVQSKEHQGTTFTVQLPVKHFSGLI